MTPGSSRRACIDIGSNTTRLLVADASARGLAVVGEERAFTRIGAALASDGSIPEATRAEVVAVVAGQLRRARELGATTVLGVATAAIRHAPNRQRLVDELDAATGLRVEVLPAEAEARLAFCGAVGMRGAGVGEVVGVLDVGGGSSEMVIGRDDGTIAWWASLALGSGSLTAAHLHHDPPTGAELAVVRSQVDAAVHAAGVRGPVPARTLAVGGSATSLGRLAGPVLDAPALRRALAVLCALPAAEVAARHAIDPERARLLPAGLIVLEVLGGALGAGVEVGRGGIREGVLLEALAR